MKKIEVPMPDEWEKGHAKKIIDNIIFNCSLENFFDNADKAYEEEISRETENERENNS